MADFLFFQNVYRTSDTDTDAHLPFHTDRNVAVQDTFHKKLYELQKSSTLTDFTLKAGTHSIPCHKVVLMASSPYFEAMMSSEMSETLTNEATLKTTNFSTLEALVQYFYLGRVVSLEYADVKGLVEAAEFLQLETLKEECQNYLIRQVNSHNCLGWCKVGMMFRLEKLVDESKRIMLNEFNRVRESHEFLELTLAELVDYISDKHLEVRRVDSLFEACKDWVMGDIETRRKHFMDLFKHLKIHDASIDRITDFITENRDIIDQEMETEIYQVFARKRKEYNVSKADQHNCLLLMGGYKRTHPAQVNTKVNICKAGEFNWKELLPDVPTHGAKMDFSVCQMQDGLLITGGRSGRAYSTEASMYLTKYNVWSEVSSMSKPRAYHGSVSVENNAIVFGGRDESGCTRHVEIFRGTPQKWIPAMPMMFETGECHTYCSSNSHVYVIMNLFPITTDGNIEDSGRFIQKYNMVRDKWSFECYIPASVPDTAGCSAVWFGDAVYLVGGAARVCTRYSPATGTWTSLNMAPQIHMHSASIVLDKKILLLGGTCDLQLQYPSADVCEYDIEKDEWKKLQQICPVSVLMASAFCIQKLPEFLYSL